MLLCFIGHPTIVSVEIRLSDFSCYNRLNTCDPQSAMLGNIRVPLALKSGIPCQRVEFIHLAHAACCYPYPYNKSVQALSQGQITDPTSNEMNHVT
jgi:hypothetical protein